MISPFAVRGGQIGVVDAAAIEDVGFGSLSLKNKQTKQRERESV